MLVVGHGPQLDAEHGLCHSFASSIGRAHARTPRRTSRARSATARWCARIASRGGAARFRGPRRSAPRDARRASPTAAALIQLPACRQVTCLSRRAARSMSRRDPPNLTCASAPSSGKRSESRRGAAEDSAARRRLRAHEVTLEGRRMRRSSRNRGRASARRAPRARVGRAVRRRRAHRRHSRAPPARAASSATRYRSRRCAARATSSARPRPRSGRQVAARTMAATTNCARPRAGASRCLRRARSARAADPRGARPPRRFARGD